MRHKSFHGLKSESYVSSMNIDENSLLNTDNASHNQSLNNWQSYFNNKMSFSAAKEKQNVRNTLFFSTFRKLLTLCFHTNDKSP